MKTRLFILKARLRLRDIARRYRRPTKVARLETFYSRHWRGAAPTSTYLTSRQVPRFFFDPSKFDEYNQALKREFPEAVGPALVRARNAAKHKFDLLGSGEVDLGEKIDWRLDFKSGKRWPLSHYPKVQIVNLDDDADIKVPWELSRLQHFTDLGRAYWLTGDEVFLNEFVSNVQSWEESNTVDCGPNWTCGMEVAIRAINIIWGLYFFSIRDSLSDEFIRKAVRLLYYHGLHIERNLEHIADGSNTNHLLADYLGLFYLGVLFPEYDRSLRWREMARVGLEKEMMLQVFEDGADYEGSTSYHRLVEEIFLSAFLLGQKNKLEFSGDFKQRLERMIDFSMAITAASGKTPLVGDNDDGFIVKLSTRDPSCHSHLVEVGLLSLGRMVPDRFAGTEERLWYHGLESLRAGQEAYKPRSVLFRQSGYAVVQDADFHLMFNAGRITEKNLAGHKHNDSLSFMLEIDRTPWLIDTGNYCYTGDYMMRNCARSTARHNTVAIDGTEQSRFFEKRLFYLSGDAKASIDLWARTDDLVIVSATHRGYSRLNGRIVHRRTIWAFLDSRSLAILDEFTGEPDREHLFETRFYTPVEDVRRFDDTTATIMGKDSQMLTIGSFSPSAGSLSVRRSEYYPRYGVKAPAHLIEYAHRSKLPFNNLTIVAYKAMPSERMEELLQAAGRFKTGQEGTMVQP